jgi:hypothetical protein
MATKKKTKSKKTAAKSKPAKKAVKKKPIQKKTIRKKKAASRKPAAKKKHAAKKLAVKTRVVGKKKRITAKPPRKQIRGRSQSSEVESFNAEESRARSAGQSGGLQGLSDAAEADSESVDELVEEGNAFEAGVVSGVEAADNADEQEVRTREVPEDDVPDEYLDQD